MPKVKLVAKKLPVSKYDIAALETWLADMAERGLFLKSLSSDSGFFTKGDPRAVRYRIEPQEECSYTESLKRHDAYKERGWCYIDSYQNLYYVYMADDGNAPELHSDTHSYILTVQRQQNQILLTTSVFLALAAFFLFIIYTSLDNIIADFILHFGVLSIYPLLGCIAIVFVPLWKLLWLIKVTALKHRLKLGCPFNHSKNYKFQKSAILCGRIIIKVVFVICIMNSLFELNRFKYNSFRPLSELSISYLRLSDIEDAKGFQYKSSGSYFDYNWSLLAPSQYKVTQSGEITNNKINPAMMTTEYYETASGDLAKILYKYRAEFHLRFTKPKEYRPVDSDFFDGVLYWCDDTSQVFAAYKGKKVVIFLYDGKENLLKSLTLIENMLMKS